MRKCCRGGKDRLIAHRTLTAVSPYVSLFSPPFLSSQRFENDASRRLSTYSPSLVPATRLSSDTHHKSKCITLGERERERWVREEGWSGEGEGMRMPGVSPPLI